MDRFFTYDDQLGIDLPSLDQPWENYTDQIQQAILSHWEKVRGQIPDRIAELEHTINQKQAYLNVEENFERSCLLNSQISDLASIINDLWIWYRTHEEVNIKLHA
ncbi:hypothetical protein [Bacillus solimangrovi]|uniref:Radical SAM protein n=1 Tax=Bacillus solimangrovi TaxID=1305675 RepID=A0A1E5LCM9_9BACI|nr:hypothetical protein [Bacillus solimangrovi]OEH91837.1 hypothetical protein BFG57_03615 [Bacillus solimangrovi]